MQVTWHASLDAVPNTSASIYIAHEFLDALPVHQFVRDPRRGWLEVRAAGVGAGWVSELQPSAGKMALLMAAFFVGLTAVAKDSAA